MHTLARLAVLAAWALAPFAGGQPAGHPDPSPPAPAGSGFAAEAMSQLLEAIAHPPDGVPEGFIVIGDVQYPIDDVIAWILSGASIDGGTEATYGPTTYWPYDGGTGRYEVPFRFSTVGGFAVSESQKNAARDAHAALAAVCNINFHELASGDARPGQIFYQNSTIEHFNNSPIGMQPVQNIVNINDWNLRTLTHETMHSLGFQHEQSRADRNDSVEIVTDNIMQIELFNFTIVPGSATYGDYDFGSIMHYTACSFSRCAQCNVWDPFCRTIRVLEPNYALWQDRIGQTDITSDSDRRLLSFLYPYNGWRFVDDGVTPPGSGSFLNPWSSTTTGFLQTPQNGRLFIQPGQYTSRGVFNRPMRIDAPLGEAVIR